MVPGSTVELASARKALREAGTILGRWKRPEVVAVGTVVVLPVGRSGSAGGLIAPLRTVRSVPALPETKPLDGAARSRVSLESRCAREWKGDPAETVRAGGVTV